ncbi:ABC transporter ATP-binding protein [Ruania zhangjianzhongii]|uniref:ABC transporter ATP-binding protein n=1 Tax=Ruania zhangjianzhongii TaxID=2603206 RepID=UPI0011D17F06|nr:ATP-binding cassette domain-containing protein [Ruania zhangjianzhongii]
MSAPILAGRHLGHSYGAEPVLTDVSIGVEPGEVVAVMGPSGSGKSTLLHLLAGLLRPDSGEVYLAGERIDRLPEQARSRLRLRQMGFVFQFGDLIPELTIAENVELPLRLTGTRAGRARRRARLMLERLEIAAHADKRISEVSGGQAQRAAVARALVHSPAVVLADEPTGSLDTTAGELVLEALIGAARESETAVVLVTHELRVASWAARDVLLRDGRVVGDTPVAGSPAQPVLASAPGSPAADGSARAGRFSR